MDSGENVQVDIQQGHCIIGPDAAHWRCVPARAGGSEYRRNPARCQQHILKTPRPPGRTSVPPHIQAKCAAYILAPVTSAAGQAAG